MAEPRVERDTRLTRHRVGKLALRGLVVAGFASGMWLLSGSAAHAAGSGPEAGGHPTGTALSRLVGDLSGVLGLGPDAATVAGRVAAPHGAVPHCATARGAAPRVVAPLGARATDIVPLAAIAGRMDAAGGQATAARLVPGPAGVDRLAGMGGMLLPGAPAELLDRVLGASGPVVDPVTDTIAPFTGVLGRVTGPVAVSATGRTRTLLSWFTHRRALPRAVAGPRRLASVVGTSTGGAKAPAATHPAGGLLGHARPAATGRHAAPRGAVRIGTEYRPILPRPAPVPASPGPGSVGLPASVSASQYHGGTSAVVATAVVTTPAALRRLPAAAHVEVRRLVAESPTVSPD